MRRRDFLFQSACAAGALVGSAAASADDGPKQASARAPLAIGKRRELFVDGQLLDRLVGGATQRLHHPTPQEIVLRHDEDWEGTGSGYHSVFQDGDKYRMYYKAWHLAVSEKKLDTNRHPLMMCYAESDDGVSWRKPPLGLHEHGGSKQNNIVMVTGKLGPLDVDPGHPAVFKDDNPAAPPEGRYKAIFRSRKPNGLLPFQSADGIHWQPMTKAPILSGLGAFDSQNLAFWDPNIGKYRAYWRIFTAVPNAKAIGAPASVRAIRTALSNDLIHWEPHHDITYVDSPPQQLYTNQIKPYCRAPHLLLGFPARYIDRGWTASMEQLPAVEQRRMRSSSSQRYGTAITDALFMASRDGRQFHRWNEAFLRPGPERPETWHYGHQYIAWHVVETTSARSGAANELSLYATEGYWHGKGSELRRYTLRLDGFVSLHGPAGANHEAVSRPLTFEGSRLHLNFATSAAGGVRIELQRPNGDPYEGYALADADVLFGDSVDRVATWKGRSDVEELAGKPVRMRWMLNDADVYSFQFADGLNGANE